MLSKGYPGLRRAPGDEPQQQQRQSCDLGKAQERPGAPCRHGYGIGKQQDRGEGSQSRLGPEGGSQQHQAHGDGRDAAAGACCVQAVKGPQEKGPERP